MPRPTTIMIKARPEGRIIVAAFRAILDSSPGTFEALSVEEAVRARTQPAGHTEDTFNVRTRISRPPVPA